MLQIDEFEVEVNYKKIKNIYLKVLPPNGSLQLSAPINTPEQILIDFVTSKKAWIQSKQKQIQSHPISAPQKYKTGETLFLWGIPYNLVVCADSPHYVVTQQEKRIELHTPPRSTLAQRETAIQEFYRQELSRMLYERMPYWEQKIGVSTHQWRIRKMKTRWGSCNTKDKRIWVNLHVATKPLCCLDYLMIHELCHLIHPNHSQDFWNCVAQYDPNWKENRALLNKS